jgi:inosose dehydratase
VWQVFWGRDGKDLGADRDGALAEVRESGLDGFEPSFGSVDEVDRLLPMLRRHELEMRSFYVNSTLHEPDGVDRSVEEIIRLARAARHGGARIVVTNPSPIQWGGAANKSDVQLRCQALALNRLGGRLKELGMRLAYHNHDIELREAGREFHHMMVGTDPELVGLCLDAHWVYRGAGNSVVALEDVVKLYGTRVCELHVRQSKEQVWTEVFGDGDIDYGGLVRLLGEAGIKPHVVLEQAIEAASPHTLDVVDAHRLSVGYARRVFAPLAVGSRAICRGVFDVTGELVCE